MYIFTTKNNLLLSIISVDRFLIYKHTHIIFKSDLGFLPGYDNNGLL